MRYYDTLAEYQRDGFDVVVDKTWEDIPLNHCFDDSIDPESGKPYYDLKEMANDIDSGRLEWFMLRVRVLVEGLELGSAYLGGMLYEDPKECLKDGTAEDMIYQALDEAKKDVYRLKQKFAELSDMVDREGITI